jgi:thiosulfate dehydrogenase [quinone] large subunit
MSKRRRTAHPARGPYWQPPGRPANVPPQPHRSIGKHLSWIVAVSPEPARIPAVVILPVRLFLAITWLYAGLQKFTDPQFFNPAAPGFVGEEMRGYVRSGSPLTALLTHAIIPNAAFVGGVIAFCELLVGLSALMGLLTRAGAIGGVLISLTFYLTASWAVHPYFLGGDLPYAFLWLILVLAGPGLYSLDEYFFGTIIRSRTRYAAMFATRQPRQEASHPQLWPPAPVHLPAIPSETVTRAAVLRGFGTAALLALLAGITGVVAKARISADVFTAATRPGSGTPVASSQTATPVGLPTASRADSSGGGSFPFPLFGSATGTPTTAAVVDQADTATPTPAPLPRATVITAAPTAVAPVATALANIASLPTNSATRFSDPTSGDPALLIHLADGSVAAFSAICTHAGCTVQYSTAQKEIVCPCHGAVFDPARNAQVMRGPARRPLAAIPVQVDAAGNVSLRNSAP